MHVVTSYSLVFKSAAFNSHATFIFLFWIPFTKYYFYIFSFCIPFHFLQYHKTLKTDLLSDASLSDKRWALWDLNSPTDSVANGTTFCCSLVKTKTWGWGGDEIVFPDSFCQGLWVGHGPGIWVSGISTFTARDTGWLSWRILNSCYFCFLCVLLFYIVLIQVSIRFI